MKASKNSYVAKLGIVIGLLFVASADTCSDCTSCNHTPRSQLVITWDDNTSSQMPADANGCADYNSKNGSCGHVTGLSDSPSPTPFHPSPSSIDLNNAPTTFSMGGSGLDTTYGMPVVMFFDGSGSVAGSTTASSVSTDGTSLTAPTPDLSGAYSGYWTLAVFNQASTGLVFLGAGDVEVTGRDYGSCYSDPGQIDNCESMIGHWWNYDTCRCMGN